MEIGNKHIPLVFRLQMSVNFEDPVVRRELSLNLYPLIEFLANDAGIVNIDLQFDLQFLGVF